MKGGDVGGFAVVDACLATHFPQHHFDFVVQDRELTARDASLSIPQCNLRELVLAELHRLGPVAARNDIVLDWGARMAHVA